MDEQIQQESSRLKAAIQTNQKAHDAAGHWGVPTYGYKGQAYFGQDRLDVLLWALKKGGLKERLTNTYSRVTEPQVSFPWKKRGLE